MKSTIIIVGATVLCFGAGYAFAFHLFGFFQPVILLFAVIAIAAALLVDWVEQVIFAAFLAGAAGAFGSSLRLDPLLGVWPFVFIPLAGLSVPPCLIAGGLAFWAVGAVEQAHDRERAAHLRLRRIYRIRR